MVKKDTMKIEKFCNLLQQEMNEESTITPETNFKELQSYGSLTAVLVLQLIEKELSIEIPPRSFRNIKTVNDIVAMVGEDKFS